MKALIWDDSREVYITEYEAKWPHSSDYVELKGDGLDEVRKHFDEILKNWERGEIKEIKNEPPKS